MKPTYHYYNIIKIMSKGYNQLKDLTIIRHTMDVRLHDYVTNAHLDYSAEYHEPSYLSQSFMSGQTQEDNYFIILELLHINIIHCRLKLASVDPV